MSGNIASKLVAKHKRYYRDFIWRHQITPYKIMIAEFMLNRTRAEQVEPVYKKFIKIYPGIKALSKARAAKLRFVTKNLGLHWRIKHYKKAAEYIIDEYHGQIPANRKDLRKIPGIGDYAAGAILTASFNKKEYVVDSNIARFIDRYYGLKLSGEIRRNKKIINYAGQIFTFKNTKLLLFAILDFTALVCKPIKPLCPDCIFNKECKYGKLILKLS